MSDNQGTTRTTGVSGDGWAPVSSGMPDFYRPQPTEQRPSPPEPPELSDATRKQTALRNDRVALGADPTTPLPSAQPEATPAPAPAQPSAVVATAPVPADVRRAGSRRTRKARLRVSRIDPWSVMKTSFLFSVAFGIMFLVAVYVLWSVIGASGLLEAVNGILQQLLSNPNDQTQYRIEDFVNTNKVLGVAALIAVVNVVILTALGTLTAFLYNLSANILGGLELTLAED